jgi:hypothetical protein
VRDRVVTEQGQVREHINIFVGEENIRYSGGLATAIQKGAEISIVPAISGGSFGNLYHRSLDLMNRVDLHSAQRRSR